VNELGKYSNSQLGVIVVYILGGKSASIGLEDIAVKLFELNPGRFSLIKYPSHLNIHTVRVSLSNSQRLPPHHLSGSIKNGYMLTPEGVIWVESLDLDETFFLDQDKGRKGSVEEQVLIEKIRLEKTSAYKKVFNKNKNDLHKNDLYEFLRINEYFPLKKVIMRIAFIKNVVDGDKELSNVFSILNNMFREEFKKYE
jgi:hypothetical protein